MEQLPTPHNNFFHFALSHLPAARSLIETQLSADALAEFDIDTLQLETGSFIDADLTEKFSDLLFSVRRVGSKNDSTDDRVMIYVLFEHKSQSDHFTVFQLLSYMVRIWEKRLRDGSRLCPIVPLVVYHGDCTWTAPRSMQDLLETPKTLAEYQVDYRYSLLDLSQLKDADIGGSTILQSTLRLLKYSRSEQLVNMLEDLLRSIANSIPAILLPEWLQAVGVYVMTVNKSIDVQDFKQTLQSILPVQIEPGSLADRLLTQGREEGREEGRQEGRQEGKLTGKIQMLQELLGDAISTDLELQNCDLNTLNARLVELQQRLRERHG